MRADIHVRCKQLGHSSKIRIGRRRRKEEKRRAFVRPL
jgi:hypothetical protein